MYVCGYHKIHSGLLVRFRVWTPPRGGRGWVGRAGEERGGGARRRRPAAARDNTHDPSTQTGVTAKQADNFFQLFYQNGCWCVCVQGVAIMEGYGI